MSIKIELALPEELASAIESLNYAAESLFSIAMPNSAVVHSAYEIGRSAAALQQLANKFTKKEQ